MDTRYHPALDSIFGEFLIAVKEKFAIEKVILFGSRARGDYKEYSDYDLIIVSQDFGKLNWHARIEEVVKLWKLDIDIDVLPYTYDEFKEKKNLRCIVQSAVQEGIEM